MSDEGIVAEEGKGYGDTRYCNYTAQPPHTVRTAFSYSRAWLLCVHEEVVSRDRWGGAAVCKKNLFNSAFTAVEISVGLPGGDTPWRENQDPLLVLCLGPVAIFRQGLINSRHGGGFHVEKISTANDCHATQKILIDSHATQTYIND